MSGLQSQIHRGLVSGKKCRYIEAQIGSPNEGCFWTDGILHREKALGPLEFSNNSLRVGVVGEMKGLKSEELKQKKMFSTKKVWFLKVIISRFPSPNVGVTHRSSPSAIVHSFNLPPPTTSNAHAADCLERFGFLFLRVSDGV